MRQILVVEDNKQVRENIAELLLNSGYDVTQAENGIAAINAFKINKPDLILCDIMMPIMDGIEFYSTIREQEFMINIPFIFLTAKADFEVQNKAMNLGADDYILKPYDSRDLLNRIKTRLDKKAKIEAKFDKLKDDISLYVPHELQTPIFPIIGYSEMILDEINNLTRLELTEMVSSIHTSAIRLKDRMEKFNKFAELRIQETEKYVNNQNDFLERTNIDSELIKNISNEKGKEIFLKIEPAQLAIAENDIKMLLFELLENACKFKSDDEKVKIEGNTVKDKYILLIQNKGEIFNIQLNEGFSQHGRNSNQQIGNGLGIAIVSLIAKKYKLKIYSKNDLLNKIYIEFDI